MRCKLDLATRSRRRAVGNAQRAATSSRSPWKHPRLVSVSLLICAGFVACMAARSQTPAAPPPPQKQWIADSNRYTQALLDVRIKHSPEYASSQGLAEYDTKIAQPTLSDELAERAERDAVVSRS